MWTAPLYVLALGHTFKYKTKLKRLVSHKQASPFYLKLQRRRKIVI